MQYFNDTPLSVQQATARHIHSQAYLRNPTPQLKAYTDEWLTALQTLNPELSLPDSLDSLVDKLSALMLALTSLAGVNTELDQIQIPAGSFTFQFSRRGRGLPWHLDSDGAAPAGQRITLTIDRVRFDGKWVEFWFQEKHIPPITGEQSYQLSAKAGALEWAINDADMMDAVYTSGLRGRRLHWQRINSNWEILGFEKPQAETPSSVIDAFIFQFGTPGTPEYEENVRLFLEQVRQNVAEKPQS